MKHLYLLILFVSISISGYAQITFEKGYIIDNNEIKTACLIKNMDWRNNPTHFEYKISPSGEIKIGDINSIKEFGINTVSKYIKEKVEIDRSSESINKLSTTKTPILKEETLFLSVLIEGQANLYFYKDGDLNRFFYNAGNKKIKQLIYKSYLVTPKGKSEASSDIVGQNKTYQNQLWSELNCGNLEIKTVKNIAYEKDDMVRFFGNYNNCSGKPFINYTASKKAIKTKINFRPGINRSSYSINNSSSSIRDIDFGNMFTIRLGVELELILPFNNAKWALLVEPNYQYFKSEAALTSIYGASAEADYESVELQIGARHYMFVNKSNSLFFNLLYNIDLVNNSVIDYEPGLDLEINTGGNIGIGIGHNWKRKYSLEMRYYSPKNTFRQYPSWNSSYKTYSLIFGYTFF
jgi:hypothetical protein